MIRSDATNAHPSGDSFERADSPDLSVDRADSPTVWVDRADGSLWSRVLKERDAGQAGECLDAAIASNQLKTYSRLWLDSLCEWGNCALLTKCVEQLEMKSYIWDQEIE